MRNAFEIIFILNVKIWKIFWTFNLLTKRKRFKIKKTSCRDNCIFFVFFHIQSYLIFQKCIWNHFHIKFENLKATLDFSFAYKRKKSSKLKNRRAGTISILLLFSRPILFNIWKMHLESFSYKMWRFESYFGLFICLQNQKKFKIQKTSRRDNFNFSAFFHIQSYLIFEKCIWNHFHIKCEDLKDILDF